MSRYREPFTLVKKPRKKGGYVWYYRLASDPKRIPHSTGTANKGEARNRVNKMLTAMPSTYVLTLRQFLEPYYVWETCPHVRRLVGEGKHMTRRHAFNQRRLLELNVFDDSISASPVHQITRGEIIDFRDRLAEAKGESAANKTISALKACIEEGVYREELAINPAMKVGNLVYEPRKRGTFLPAELLALFPWDAPGPWRDLQAYTCFVLAWSCGMRRGETFLALRWRHLDLVGKVLHVEEADKGKGEIGDPKWGHQRDEALSDFAVRAIVLLREDSIHTLPDDLVFAEDEGGPHSEQWWRDSWAEALKNADIQPGARWLTPHSLRHTINTQLLDEGVDASKVRAMLGWTNEATQKGYTHWEAEHTREAAEVVDKFLSASRPKE